MNPRKITIIYDKGDVYGKINSSKSSVELLRPLFTDIELRERAIVMYLDVALNVLGYHLHSIGTLQACFMDVRAMMMTALQANASGIIVAHNHPSGLCIPSKVDINITEKIKKGCEYLHIKFHDHLIVTKDSYYSFCDEGII